jgi:MFS family permease
MLTRKLTSRRTLSPTSAYAPAAGIVGLALFASGVPSPLYLIYRELWGFSPLVLTLVYATYAFGVLATLIIAGRLSDDVGRRPVLLSALASLMVLDERRRDEDADACCPSSCCSRCSRSRSPACG